MKRRTTAALMGATVMLSVVTLTGVSYGADVANPPTPVSGTPATVVYNQTTSTVNGQPFLPLGIYGVENPADFATIHGYGLNVIQSYHIPSMTDTDVTNYLNAASANHLMVLFSLGINSEDTAAIAAAKARVLAFKNNPAVYAWYLSDEPSTSNISPATLTSVYQWIKDNDPNHPVLTSNWELSSFKDATDLDMRQMYDGSPSRLESNNASYFSYIASTGKSWVSILNTFDSTWGMTNPPTDLNPADYMSGLTPGTTAYNDGLQRTANINNNLENPQYPAGDSFPNTPNKVKGAAFWALLHGSNGLYYWLFEPVGAMNTRWGYYTLFEQTPLRNAFIATMQQIHRLSSFLVDPTAGKVNTWGTSGGVEYWVRRTANGPVIVAVNESEQTQTVTTTLPSTVKTRSGTFTVDSEGRTVNVSGGSFTDTFRPDEAHVYLGPSVKP